MSTSQPIPGIAQHVMRQDRGPWVSDGDRWCCDYCGANPRTFPLPSSCHACGTSSDGGAMPSDPTAKDGVMPLMSLITARGD